MERVVVIAERTTPRHGKGDPAIYRYPHRKDRLDIEVELEPAVLDVAEKVPFGVLVEQVAAGEVVVVGLHREGVVLHREGEPCSQELPLEFRARAQIQVGRIPGHGVRTPRQRGVGTTKRHSSGLGLVDAVGAGGHPEDENGAQCRISVGALHVLAPARLEC